MPPQLIVGRERLVASRNPAWKRAHWRVHANNVHAQIRLANKGPFGSGVRTTRFGMADPAFVNLVVVAHMKSETFSRAVRLGAKRAMKGCRSRGGVQLAQSLGHVLDALTLARLHHFGSGALQKLIARGRQWASVLLAIGEGIHEAGNGVEFVALGSGLILFSIVISLYSACCLYMYVQRRPTLRARSSI